LTSFTFNCGSQQANNVILVKLLARPMRRLALCHGAPSRQGSRNSGTGARPMKLTILFVVVVGAILIWWLKAVKPKLHPHP
jgi:hypothetical protein